MTDHNELYKPELIEDDSYESTESSRSIAHTLEILLTTLNGQFKDDNKEAEGEMVRLVLEAKLLAEAMSSSPVSSEDYKKLIDELEVIIQKLDAAIAINNDPSTRKFQLLLIENLDHLKRRHSSLDGESGQMLE